MKKLLVSVGVVALLVGYIFADDGENTTFGLAATDNIGDSVFADTSYNQYTRSFAVGSDLDQDGKPEIIVTDYKNGGRVHVFEVAGDDSIQEVWMYPGNGYTAYSSTARSVKTGDLDGDGYGEILVAMTGSSGDTSRQHVGLWVFEWTGNDNEYYLAEQINEFGFEQGGFVLDRFRCEDLAVGDFDGDGVQEVLWVNNGGTSSDNAYIFSISGDLGTHFYTVNQEFIARRTDLGWGGSSVSGFVTDLDADGNTDVIVLIWNNLGLQIIEATGPDAYEVKGYIDNIDTEDRYPFAKIVDAGDLDGDGKPELVFGSLLRSRFHVIEAGNDVNASDLTVHTVEFMVNDTTPMFSMLGLRVGDQDHGPGSDAMDIYFTDDYGHVYDFEYTGTDFSDTASYDIYDIYSDFWSDSAQYDTVWVYYSMVPGVAIELGNDLDGDGQKEVVFNAWESRSSSDYPYMPHETGFINVLEHDWVGVHEWSVGYLNPVALKVYPTPTNEATTIRFNMTRRGHATVTLFDITGRKVSNIYNGILEKGRHEFNLNVSNLASGVYFVKVSTPDGEATSRLVISR